MVGRGMDWLSEHLSYGLWGENSRSAHDLQQLACFGFWVERIHGNSVVVCSGEDSAGIIGLLMIDRDGHAVLFQSKQLGATIHNAQHLLDGL